MAVNPIRRPARAHAHRDPALLGVVFVGGAIGTAIRSLLEDAFAGPATSWPWTTFAINVSGAFVLGFLLEALVRSGEDAGGRRLARLGIGTGVLGGFTTYSTFMVETTKLSWAQGISYVGSSVLLGAIAAWAGIRAAKGLVRIGETV
ncbi:putative fluoride ion transporter CrcB [Flexivirga endophytica]|uniref:Fluoride-specific ion channel FluC n=1 Tax=Flexivirga endophytica TaxID=1849103 RepID=A0A916SVP6_9MICO|nr:CrcB family protein [Flexivirga endophytica]GGB20198.1 putative fluoride ion transporter CrcB [Flexivirga endophytica]GHB71254.1 putative fluoride ion transporter CrcB [Flexivirga endophytica]